MYAHQNQDRLHFCEILPLSLSSASNLQQPPPPAASRRHLLEHPLSVFQPGSENCIILASDPLHTSLAYVRRGPWTQLARHCRAAKMAETAPLATTKPFDGGYGRDGCLGPPGQGEPARFSDLREYLIILGLAMCLPPPPPLPPIPFPPRTRGLPAWRPTNAPRQVSPPVPPAAPLETATPGGRGGTAAAGSAGSRTGGVSARSACGRCGCTAPTLRSWRPRSGKKGPGAEQDKTTHAGAKKGSGCCCFLHSKSRSVEEVGVMFFGHRSERCQEIALEFE